MSTIRGLKIKASIGGTMIFAASIIGGAAKASDFNAEKVMKEMNNEQQISYFAGVIEGLA